MIGKKFKEFAKSTLYHRIGIEIYKYGKDFEGLADIYSSRIKNLGKIAGKRFINNLKATKKILKSKNVNPFYIESESDYVYLPFEKAIGSIILNAETPSGREGPVVLLSHPTEKSISKDAKAKTDAEIKFFFIFPPQDNLNGI